MKEIAHISGLKIMQSFLTFKIFYFSFPSEKKKRFRNQLKGSFKDTVYRKNQMKYAKSLIFNDNFIFLLPK